MHLTNSQWRFLAELPLHWQSWAVVLSILTVTWAYLIRALIRDWKARQ